MLPLVSIIMPTYNRADLLPRSISSVLRQSEIRWELIIIDDGSVDDTKAILSPYLRQDARLRYIRRPHRGVYSALNSGIRLARGKYLMILGSDDELTQSHINRRVTFLGQRPTVDLLHGGMRIIGSPYVIDKDNPEKKIHLNNCAVSGTFFGKRTVFQALRGFQVRRYGGDAAFLAEARKQFEVTAVSWPTYIYHRDTPGSITNTKLAKNKA